MLIFHSWSDWDSLHQTLGVFSIDIWASWQSLWTSWQAIVTLRAKVLKKQKFEQMVVLNLGWGQVNHWNASTD